MVADGRFREDLYYRLQGIVVQVPPLRDRRQEIPGLVEQFRSEVAASGESRVRGFATDAMDELFRREWPGNIRELRNAVYRAMVLATGELVERRDVFAALPVQAGGAGGGIQPLLPMPAASPAMNLRPHGEQRPVDRRPDGIGKRLPETGPARAAVILRFG
jgi:DNA-binding NtrC family response regulator